MTSFAAATPWSARAGHGAPLFRQPAFGDGRNVKVLTDHGQAVVSTDLYAYGTGEAEGGAR